MNAAELVDYASSLDCIHCGLCLQTCPTYRLTGHEASSPRGRVHLMRAVAEGRAGPDATYAEELDFCLVCRHCESVCPSGVRFGEMMVHARDGLEAARPRPLAVRLARWLGFRIVLPHRLPQRLLASLLRLAQITGLVRLARLFGDRGLALTELPPVPPAAERRALQRTTPARGERRGALALLEGCVARELFGRANRATVETLAALGFDVHSVRQATCCGALQAHNGDLEGARRLARRLVLAFDEQVDEAGQPLRVVVNAAGCGAHLRTLGTLLEGDAELGPRAADLARRVVDFSELVAAELPDGARLVPAPGTPLGPLAWDDPCHLCHGQGIRRPPRELLDRLEGVERVEMEGCEGCCGSAGIYSLLRPEDSRAVFAEKLAAFERSGARALVTANPGCQMQWSSGLARAGIDAPVLHLAEVLAGAYRAPAPDASTGTSTSSSSSTRSVEAG